MKLFIQGTIEGFKTKENFNKETGELKKKLYVGLSSPKLNGYDGEVEITDVRISEDQVEQGVQSELLKLKGKEVIAQVDANEWNFGKRTGIAWTLSKVNNVQVIEKKQLKEAS